MQIVRPRVLAALLAPVAALTAVMVVSAPAASAQPTASAVTVPITGTNGINSFAGNFTLTRFQVVNGALSAVGTLSGTITNIATGATTTVTDAPVTLPVGGSSASATCQILHLELGPLDLTLLGLNVHLNRVVLDITATSGPGNLLGNLLCGVAHLLDSNAGATTLARLLNNLLGGL
jgi:hypothetical protein